MSTDPIAAGRAGLAAWRDAQPENLYVAAHALRALQRRDWSEAEQARWRPVLERFGAVVAGELDAVVAENNREGNLPRLAGWDGIGRRAHPVDHHPTWRRAGQLMYGSGMMAAYAEQPAPHTAILSLFYLSAMVGEGGHNCPFACDAGAIRALQELGSPEQRARYLPRLLDPDFDRAYTAAQWLTEVQGGSDVGANGTVAVPTGQGTWRLHGEKWFCSNVDADVILTTARPEGGRDGTRGLGLFLVAACLPDGSHNAFSVRRLKEKLGTRSMASGEVDWNGAVAESLGPVEEGFANVMRLVITTSRLYNAMAVAGPLQRACVVAGTYAACREAFGQPVGRFPLVQESLAWMQADADGCVASTWLLLRTLERIERGEATGAEQAFFRLAVNLNKLRTAALAHEGINRGIEVLGGNGAIESFSVLPRLLRDNVVCENWEGTHNVLRAQVLRDCARVGVEEGFFAVLSHHLDPDLVGAERESFRHVLLRPDPYRSLAMREAADRLATLVQLAGLGGTDLPALDASATLIRRRHLQGGGPVDAAYVALLEAVLER